MIECEEPCLLKLVARDNGNISTYVKLVDDRNGTAHANGNIFFSTQAALDAKITEILRVVDEIQTHSKPVIEQAYRQFLLQNHDPDERGPADRRRRGETPVSCYTFLETSIGCEHALGLPWTRQK